MMIIHCHHHFIKQERLFPLMKDGNNLILQPPLSNGISEQQKFNNKLIIFKKVQTKQVFLKMTKVQTSSKNSIKNRKQTIEKKNNWIRKTHGRIRKEIRNKKQHFVM